MEEVFVIQVRREGNAWKTLLAMDSLKDARGLHEWLVDRGYHTRIVLQAVLVEHIACPPPCSKA